MVAGESSPIRQLVLTAAIAAAVYAQLSVHRDSNDTMAWLLLAVAALAAALVAGQRGARPAPPASGAAAPAGNVLRLACAVLAVAACAGATWYSSRDQLPILTLLLWLASAPLAALAVRGWRVTPPRQTSPPWSGGERATVALLLAGAAAARLLWIDELPRAIFGDEPRVAMYLFNAYHGGRVPTFFSMGWNTWPVVGLSLQGLFAPLAGLHVTALRLSSALMGTLAVLSTYLLARELFGARTALLAAFLFAICRTAIDFSRLGITHAQVLFLEPLALYFLWRALNGGWAAHYVWAGIATAWCLYTYNAGQLVPPLVFGWLALGALARPRRIATHWRGAALLLAGFALTLFPYLYDFTDAFHFGPNWGQWTIMARNRQTMGQVADTWRAAGAGPAWEILRRQIWTTWLGFGVLPGGGYPLSYRRGGMLDDVSAALFFLGLAICVRRLRSGAEAFTAYWWSATVLAGGIATIDPPSFVRMVGLLPALAILAAQPLESLLRAGAGRFARPLALLAVLALATGAAWDNWRTYFVEFASRPVDPVSELARYMAALPADHDLWVFGSEHFLAVHNELFMIEFPNRADDVPDAPHALPLHRPVREPLVLVLPPQMATMSGYVQSLYPDAVVTDVGSESLPLSFRTIRLSPEDVARRVGLALAATFADGASRTVPVADPFADLPGETGAAARLEWSGSVYWPTDQPTTVQVDAGQPTTVTIADAPPIRADGRAAAVATMTLPRGWQPLRIEERREGPHRLAITLAQPLGTAPLTRWDLRPEAAREGLNATYVRGDGSRLLVVDPQLNAMAVEDRYAPGHQTFVRMPFTAVWTGALQVDRPGRYRFEAIGSGPYSVRLDDTPLFSASPTEPEQPAIAQAERELTAGLHPIRAEFDSTKPAHTTRRLFQLYWTPPGGEKALIPPSSFRRDSVSR